jgi:hypothetical protein
MKKKFLNLLLSPSFHEKTFMPDRNSQPYLANPDEGGHLPTPED